MVRFAAGLVVCACLAIAAAPALAADHLYGITTSPSQHIVAFDPTNPITLTGDHLITGLGSGVIVGMDVSPRDGGIYGLGSPPTPAWGSSTRWIQTRGRRRSLAS